ncbi:MAG: TonB-dependent receptor plug domain-containing protein [Gemmatimonadales bacterium]|nr:TonB-dependent receptor plug domain-containing protein [Gemmatimonadales bacterium]
MIAGAVPVLVRAVALALAALLSLGPSVTGQAPAAPGRIAGRAVDAQTGRPLVSVRIAIVGQTGIAETDLDGRFRTGSLAPGFYTVRAALIGYTPVRIDSVRVSESQTATITLALKSAPAQIEDLIVEAATPQRAASDAGLLAAQHSAMAVVDGISSESIKRTPDSDAGQAITRVTGLAVVQDRVVVRGLAERYSTALLNGVEVASPEPDRKFVALGAFDADLIESIIAAKTATPDRPGDFAGGLVDIQTKEFPENSVLSFGISQGWNSRSTFKAFPRAPRHGSDILGFNGSRRGFQSVTNTSNLERVSESLANVWTPQASKAPPSAGFKFSLGGRKDLGNSALGMVASFDYGTGREYNPDRFDYQGEAPMFFDEASESVQWSGIFNLAYRLGSTTKFGFKNFYSRSSEETVRVGFGGDNGDGPSINYQMRYLQQFVSQSQLTGDHYFAWLGRSRVEWKASYGQAGRADLDNRQLRYLDGGEGFRISNIRPHNRWNIDLDDKSYSAQLDWSVPFSLRSAGDALFKFGPSYRRKDRAFVSTGLHLEQKGQLPAEILGLPPELLLAPENLGPGQFLYEDARVLSPYDAREEVRAGYLMADFELLRALRIVGGVRYERWKASLEERNIIGGNAATVDRDDADLLWSANLTYALSAKTNLRAAGYRTVARPDLRELSTTGYAETVGGFVTIGNDSLQRSAILNADLRFEVYPAAEELFAISAFYKRFEQPLVTTYLFAGGNVVRPDNGNSATSYGLELEVRKRLGFLSGSLGGVLVNGNLTLIRSRVVLTGGSSTVIGSYTDDLKFQGQSPYLVNLGLTYSTPGSGLGLSVLFNRFGDRILRYGQAAQQAELESQGPNLIERGRSQLDAKLRFGLWSHWDLSVSGKNLLNASSELLDDAPPTAGGPAIVRGRTRNGVGLSVSISYGR